MHTSRLTRAVAGVIVAALAIVGLVPAPASAAEFTRTVSGHVYLGDATRSAVAGEVTVTARLTGMGSVSTSTDAAGNYSLAIASTLTTVYPLLTFTYNGTEDFNSGIYPSYPTGAYSGTRTIQLSADRPGTDMILPRSQTVTGQVLLGTSRTPAPAGTVAIVWQRMNAGNSGMSPDSTPVLVDADGRYSLTLPGGYYLFKYMYVGQNGPFATIPYVPDSLFAPWPLFDKPIEQPTQTMYPPNSASGRVTLGTARTPAAAGTVKVTPSFWVNGVWTRDESKAAVTDSAGGYMVRGVNSGSVRLDYEWVGTPAGAYAPQTAYGTLSSGRPYVADENPNLTALSSISGRVSLGDPTRPAGANFVRVTAGTFVLGQWRAAGSAMTDGDGRFTIPGLATTTEWTLRYDYLGEENFGDRATSKHSLSAGPITNADIVLPLEMAIGGRVTDSGGTPLRWVSVVLRAYSPDGREQYTRTVQTDAAGRYQFIDLDDENFFTVEFSLSGYARQTWPDSGSFYEPDYISLTEGEIRADVDVTVYRSASISGQVTRLGAPTEVVPFHVASVEVMVYDAQVGRWAHAGMYTTTQSDGSYLLGELPPDDYRLQVTYLSGRGEASMLSPVLHVEEAEVELYTATVRPFLRDTTGDLVGDVLVRNIKGDLVVYPGNGSGGFLAPRKIGSGWSRMTGVVHAGDFNGDGHPDVIARDSSGYLWLYKGNGTGGWLGSTRIGSGWNSMNVIIGPGDFNGDGFGDIVSRDAAGNLWLYKGNGKGGWLGSTRIGTGWASFTAVLASSDMNQDGFADLIGRDSAGALWLYPGNGKSGWLPRVKLGSGWGSFTAIFSVGDFDGDWYPDVIARDATGGLWLFPGNGTGGLDPKYRIGSGWASLLIIR
ncbi:FG-GAP-like repeat-containing protein [Microbacterium sp.]|uniref:FG-GAP-like repeat-containing protein n=1 Tax=Microbacterium sp. TaxID=51671 RepID=UPI003F708C9C